MSEHHDMKRIMAKIQKCLSLSDSSNEHEAAAAMRQARKLMAKEVRRAPIKPPMNQSDLTSRLT